MGLYKNSKICSWINLTFFLFFPHFPSLNFPLPSHFYSSSSHLSFFSYFSVTPKCCHGFDTNNTIMSKEGCHLWPPLRFWYGKSSTLIDLHDLPLRPKGNHAVNSNMGKVAYDERESHGVGILDFFLMALD